MSWAALYQDNCKIQAPLEAGEAPCEPVGEEVQRLSVIRSLPTLLTDDEPQCMQKIIPQVQKVLPTASCEFQMAASTTFLTILEKSLVHPKTFTKTFLQSILSSIDSKDPVVANAWLETLLDVIDLLPTDLIKTDILPIAIRKGQLSQPVSSRLIACKMLGKVAGRFDQYVLKKEALPLVLSLCQDVKYEVRACICSQLPYVAQGLGGDTVKVTLLPALVELSSDDKAMVRLAAIETIVQLMPLLPSDTVKQTITPLVKKLCDNAMLTEDEVMCKVTEQLGKMCLGLESYLVPSEKSYFVSYYKHMSQRGVPQLQRDIAHPDFLNPIFPDISSSGARMDLLIECRKHCAFNLPAMVAFACRSGPSKDTFLQQLYTALSDLASDPYFNVRRTIACSLHEVARVLGSGNCIVRHELVKLLQDEAEEVLEGLIPNMAATLEQLASSGTISSQSLDTAAMEICQAVAKCEDEVSQTNNWRLHSQLLGQMEVLPYCVPSDSIYKFFMPTVFNRILLSRPLPCRIAAARTTLVFMRYNTKAVQRNQIKTRINQELFGAKCCYRRMMFIRMCEMVIQIYSRKFFKENFFIPLLDLYNDKVPNIRLKLVSLFPRLKLMLRMPADRKLLLAIELCVRNLMNSEKDRDVSAQLRLVIEKLDKIEAPQESGSNQTKDDVDDRKKLDEETKISSGGPNVDKSRGRPEPILRNRNITKMVPVAKEEVGPLGIPRASRPISKASRYASPVGSPVSSPSVGSGPATALREPLMGWQPLTPSAPTNNGPEFYPGEVHLRALSLLRESILASRDFCAGFSTLEPGLSPPYDLHPTPGLVACSFEDEFYVDAGVRIPQQLADSGLTRLPSRIPNVRELLFRNTDLPSCLDPKPQKQNNEQTPRSGNPGPAQKSCNLRKPFTAGTNKRNSGVFGTKVDAPKMRPVSADKAKQASTVITNRRHSYVEAEKFSKESFVVIKKCSVVENRRHSYLDERSKNCVGSTTKRHSYMDERSKSNETVKRHGYNERAAVEDRGKLGETLENKRRGFSERVELEEDSKTENVPGNKRHSYNEGLRRDLASKRKVVYSSLDRENKVAEEVKRRPLGVTGTLIGNRRHSSLERENKSAEEVKRRSLGPNVTATLANNRRHSSLERENKAAEEVKRRVPGPNVAVALANNRRHSSLERENLDMRRLYGYQPPAPVYRGRIPRGGTSCHSSPGTSRATSPTLGARLRQRTAPNSRATSPTRLQQRLSLGSLNSYMGSLRIGEAGSRLPVRRLKK